MKNTLLPGLLVAATLAALTFVGPAIAQESQSGQSGTGTGTTTSAGTTTTETRSDNNSNWGWLGLLGLAGLAGLRKPAPTVVHHERETVAKTY